MMPTPEDPEKRNAAREVIDILQEMSILLVRIPIPYSFLIYTCES